MNKLFYKVPLKKLVSALIDPAGTLLHPVESEISFHRWNYEQILICGIEYDSRKVKPGDLFVALSGGNTDGHIFIPDAIHRGASAIVGTKSLDILDVPYYQVKDSRCALAYLSAAFYGFPAHRLTVIGVTGTDGKTTTCNLIYQILNAAGIKAGMISTVNAVIADQEIDTGFHVTTPEAPDVQRYLAMMVAAGLTHVVLETTSHGLDQQRVTACEFDIAVVTNITHEHLDYHGDYDAYRTAKAQLFSELFLTPPKPQGNPRLAVLNRDDHSYEFLSLHINQLIERKKPISFSADDQSPTYRQISAISYGCHQTADVRSENIISTYQGLQFTARSMVNLTDNRVDKPDPLQINTPISTKLLGTYNVSNCLAAFVACVVGLGIDPMTAQSGIAALAGIPGRMELIDMGQNFVAMVDFAHTPNALRRLLETTRQIVPGRIITVFGSAGLRDKQKRRMMAETSAELSDLSILTAEDPRTESLAEILAEMANGAVSHGGVEGITFWRIQDRRSAIRFALTLAKPGDLVVACGKGHEQSMCFGDIEYPWDDRTAMRAALAEYLSIPGPAMPFLPETTDV